MHWVEIAEGSGGRVRSSVNAWGDQIACFRGYPAAVRTDNGPEFTSSAFLAWTRQHGIRHILIQPDKPM